ncbi:MAG: hypothetical protein ACXV8Q_00405 [Methylobacter sp.]
MPSIIHCLSCDATLSEAVGPCPHCGGPIELSISLTGQEIKADSGNLTPWLSATFAPRWYKDALSEANQNQPTDRDARRKEIIFAVACAESYLFEWVRDEVLNSDYEALETYFPTGQCSGVKERWKDVTKRLDKDNQINNTHDFSRSTAWKEFNRLIDFRNGLLHGGASRPETAGLTNGFPVPSMRELDALRPGWAIDVVRSLIFELSTVAGTPPPNWIN